MEAYYINDVDDRVVVHGETEQPFDQEIVCFDIETTGLNRKYEVIIEIGAVVLKNGEITDRFNTFVSPGRILSPEIIRLTGITDEMLVGAPSQEEALRAFLAFAGDRPPGGPQRRLRHGLYRRRLPEIRHSLPQSLHRQPDPGPEPAA